MAGARRVVIRGDAIELGAFLKWAGAARTGGEAKTLVQRGAVTVNGERETRRSRRLSPGDVVAVAGRGTFLVAAGEERGGLEPAD